MCNFFKKIFIYLPVFIYFKIDLDTYSQAIKLESAIPTELHEIFLQSACCNSSANLVNNIKKSFSRV